MGLAQHQNKAKKMTDKNKKYEDPCNPFSSNYNGQPVGPDSFGGSDYQDCMPYLQEIADEYNMENEYLSDYPPLDSMEAVQELEKIYKSDPKFHQGTLDYTQGSMEFNEKDAWIQTYSGRRFNPTNPVVKAIVIQDIAHSLSMQCRFSGHTKQFYSVAQHSVLVSYFCDYKDRGWGLMHDSSEAYLVDVPRPLKHSGKFNDYLRFEKNMQKAICERFNLPEQEPESVKRADKLLLVTEARDLMYPLRNDWIQECDPLPFKIDPWPPEKAKDIFMKRFFELFGYNPTDQYKKYSKQVI